MPGKQHDNLKIAIWDFLDRKLSGCMTCEFPYKSDDTEGHKPTFRHHFNNEFVELLFFCEKGHPHQYDVLYGAGYVVNEERQTLPDGRYCVPDITVLNTHREPISFIEVHWSSKKGKSKEIAEELGIPLFVFNASEDQSTAVPPLYRNLPYFERLEDISDEEKRHMRAMHRAASELFEKHGNADPSLWSEMVMSFDDTGEFAGSTIHHPEPTVEDNIPKIAGMLFADRCLWECERVVEAWRSHQELMSLESQRSQQEQLVTDMGEIVLSAMESIPDFHNLRRAMGRGYPARGAAQFVIPIGSEQVRIGLTIEPLDQTPDPFMDKLGRDLRDAYQIALKDDKTPSA